MNIQISPENELYKVTVQSIFFGSCLLVVTFVLLLLRAQVSAWQEWLCLVPVTFLLLNGFLAYLAKEEPSKNLSTAVSIAFVVSVVTGCIGVYSTITQEKALIGVLIIMLSTFNMYNQIKIKTLLPAKEELI